MYMIRTVAVVLVATVGTSVFARSAPVHATMHSAKPLIVHEWGTVTTRHALDGAQEGRLNRISSFYEPLPGFVHHVDPGTGARRIPIQKGDIVDGRPDVTMRLETPVLYFHPSPGDSIAPFDVSVDFRGGWLNEFYPNASVDAHGWDGKQIDERLVSTLTWRGVTLHNRVALPVTLQHVWLAPRAVSARPLSIGVENEQYIFYRGLAHLEPALRTRFDGGELHVLGPRTAIWFASPTARLGKLWLVDVRPNGVAAVRETDSLTLTRGDTTREVARFRDFAQSEYSTTALNALRASMQAALVGRGLYTDEARAMLETWSRSYFAEPGLRLFYIVPSEWVSYHLPLRISVPHDLTRVIVGRIDLPLPATP
jgi:hypothetical protein